MEKAVFCGVLDILVMVVGIGLTWWVGDVVAWRQYVRCRLFEIGPFRRSVARRPGRSTLLYGVYRGQVEEKDGRLQNPMAGSGCLHVWLTKNPSRQRCCQTPVSQSDLAPVTRYSTLPPSGDTIQRLHRIELWCACE